MLMLLMLLLLERLKSSTEKTFWQKKSIFAFIILIWPLRFDIFSFLNENIVKLYLKANFYAQNKFFSHFQTNLAKNKTIFVIKFL